MEFIIFWGVLALSLALVSLVAQSDRYVTSRNARLIMEEGR